MESASAKEIKRQLQALRANIGENFKGLIMMHELDLAIPYFEEQELSKQDNIEEDVNVENY